MTSHHTIKDNQKRQLCIQYEWRRLHYQSIADNLSLPMEVRFQARLEMTDLPRDSSKVRVRNRCILTGRSRGIYKHWRISRIKIRELIAQNKLPGVRKSSW